MSDPMALLRLLQISDSAFPSGGFAFSNGLETLAQEQDETTRRSRGAEIVRRFIEDQLLARWASFDRWFLIQSLAAAPLDEEERLTVLIALDRQCEAQNTVASLSEASKRMGRAALASHTRIGTERVAPYQIRLRDGRAPGHLPVVQGLIAGALRLTAEQAAASAAFQLVSGALSSAVRLGLIGALEAQSIQTLLAPTVGAALARPLGDAPHAFAPYADIAAMRHSAGDGRLFAA